MENISTGQGIGPGTFSFPGGHSNHWAISSRQQTRCETPSNTCKSRRTYNFTDHSLTWDISEEQSLSKFIKDGTIQRQMMVKASLDARPWWQWIEF